MLCPFVVPRHVATPILHPRVPVVTNTSGSFGRSVGVLAFIATGRIAAFRASRRATSTPREQQVLPFVEPQSGREVVLIASVHFNPQSVEKATSVTNRLVQEKQLGAVVLETCPTRWKKVGQMQEPGSPLRVLLDNEMQAAEDVARGAGKEVILGDQRIEELFEQIGVAWKEALDDLLDPPNGWWRTGTEILQGLQLLFERKSTGGSADDRLGLWDFADPKLVFGFAVAVPRYLLSTALKAPILILYVIGLYIFSNVLAYLGILGDLLFVAVEMVLLRIILCVLLRDRDLILAQSIRRTCGTLSNPGAVVAVLGAAHCNGVKRHLLTPEEVPSA